MKLSYFITQKMYDDWRKGSKGESFYLYYNYHGRYFYHRVEKQLLQVYAVKIPCGQDLITSEFLEKVDADKCPGFFQELVEFLN